MQSLYSFIIQPKNGRYTNEVEVGDKKLIVNTTMDDHKFVNRVGIVMSVPLIGDTDLSVGDEVIVHHNVFRRFYDVRGNEKNSTSYFKEDMYFCYLDQVYMYKRNEDWVAMPGYCFVNPIQSEDKWENKEEPLKGIVVYTDGSDIVKKGELVGFTPYSEFEFIVGDKRLYRIKLNDISIKYEHKGTEKLYNTSWL